MKATLSVLVKNHAGVLSKVSGMFSRRGYNIQSLAVGETHDPTISCMTIVVDGDQRTLQQIEKQLNKVIPVIKVKRLPDSTSISRVLTLFKVSFPLSRREELLKTAELMGAKIVDAGKSTVTLELTDTAERTAVMEQLLVSYGLKEVVRTGTVAIEKG